MATYTIICPKCSNELTLRIHNKGEDCEVCACGFPENETIYGWKVA